MADSFITVPPDSTGKSLDTRTVPDGNHREVVVVGSPTLADVAEADATNGLDVDVTRSVLPTGAATLAEQQTETAHLATIAGDTTAIETAVQIMDDWDETNRAAVNTIAGQVGVQGASGVITALTQRVVLATDQPTVPVSLAAGGTTQYAEDTAHVSGDLVTMAGVVQQSADAALSTDGDRSALQVDASGWAKVNVKGSALPTGAATSALQTQPGVDIGDVTVNNAAGAAAVNIQDGGNSLTVDNAALSVVGGGVEATALRVTLASDSTGLVSVDDNGGSLTVDGTVAVSGTVDTELPAAAALADATANPTTPLVGAALETFNGTTWDRARGDTTNGLDVDVTRLPALVAGTANIGDVDVLTLPALVAGTANIGDVDIASAPTGASSITVQGTAAHAAAAVGNPVYIAGRASTALPTDVGADGDAAAIWTNRNGLVVVSGIPGAGLNADPYTLLSKTAQYTTTQTSAVLLAGGASERIIVTSIQIQVGGATAGSVQVYFGTGAYARGTNSAIFDGEFTPSATNKPGFAQSPPSGYRAPALGDDVLVTDSAAINPLTITIWFYLLGV